MVAGGVEGPTALAFGRGYDPNPAQLPCYVSRGERGDGTFMGIAGPEWPGKRSGSCTHMVPGECTVDD